MQRLPRNSFSVQITTRYFSYSTRSLTNLNQLTKQPKMSAPTPNQDASMLSGHATYAKGYVAETIGNVTGSKEWQESGKKDAQAGIEEMKVCTFFL
jgi:uncharacterized protein YjbJ (UPF0337 family)